MTIELLPQILGLASLATTAVYVTAAIEGGDSFLGAQAISCAKPWPQSIDGLGHRQVDIYFGPRIFEVESEATLR